MQGFVNLINFYFGNIRRLTYQMFTLRKGIILRKKKCSFWIYGSNKFKKQVRAGSRLPPCAIPSSFKNSPGNPSGNWGNQLLDFWGRNVVPGFSNIVFVQLISPGSSCLLFTSWSAKILHLAKGVDCRHKSVSAWTFLLCTNAFVTDA